MRMAHTYNPRGRPTKAFRYINALAGVKSAIKREVAKDVKKDIVKDIKLGRPHSEKRSLKIEGGHLIVKDSKSRTIRVGNKSLVV